MKMEIKDSLDAHQTKKDNVNSKRNKWKKNESNKAYEVLKWKTSCRFFELKGNASTINGLKNQVGIFYSYQTIWIALVRSPFGGYCYLNHVCIVIYLCPHWVK